jgi:hypothetical protein
LSLPAESVPSEAITALHLAILSDSDGESVSPRVLLFTAHTGTVRLWDMTAGNTVFEFTYQPPAESKKPWWPVGNSRQYLRVATAFLTSPLFQVVGSRLFPNHPAGVSGEEEPKTQPSPPPAVVKGVQFLMETTDCSLVSVTFIK